MSEGFFGRVMNLLRGAGAQVLNNLERDNPEAVYQAAIEAETRRLSEARASIRSLKAQAGQLDHEAKRLEEEIEALTLEAATLADNDEEKALECLVTKEAKREKLEANRTYRKALTEQLSDNEALLPKIQERLEELKKERDQMLLRLKTAALADEKEGASLEGIPSNASQAALQQVRERIAETESRRQEARKAAEDAKHRAKAELERLKAARKGHDHDPTPSSTSSSKTDKPTASKKVDKPAASKDEAAAASPKPRVKRTL